MSNLPTLLRPGMLVFHMNENSKDLAKERPID
jgi:hypothetical protein